MENQDRLRKMENQYRLQKIQAIIQSKIFNEYDMFYNYEEFTLTENKILKYEDAIEQFIKFRKSEKMKKPAFQFIKTHNQLDSLKNKTLMNLRENHEKYSTNLLSGTLVLYQLNNCQIADDELKNSKDRINKIISLHHHFKKQIQWIFLNSDSEDSDAEDAVDKLDKSSVKKLNIIFKKEIKRSEKSLFDYIDHLVINKHIRRTNKLIFNLTKLIDGYNNKFTRHPRCPHYKNKFHSHLITEFGSMLICCECAKDIHEGSELIKEEEEYPNLIKKISNQTKIKKLIVIPY